MTLARQGMGVALGQRSLAAADLESGALIVVSNRSLQLGHPYSAFTPAQKQGRVDVERLLALLVG